MANISLNSELNLVLDTSRQKSTNIDLTIVIQFADKARKMGQFKSDQTLWQVINQLFTSDDIPELNDCDQYIFSINYMNKQVKIIFFKIFRFF